AASRTPFMPLKALMWLPPRLPKPTTATRMLSLAPGDCAQMRAGRLKPAVVMREVLRKLRRVSLFMVLLVLSAFGHDKWRTIRPGEQFIRFGVSEETFRFRIHFQWHPERDFVFGNIDFVCSQMFGHAAKALGQAFVALDSFLDFIRRFGGPQTIGNVAGMAKGAGEVAFENVGVERFSLAIAHCFEPVLVVPFGA